jgi:hypothetical protein
MSEDQTGVVASALTDAGLTIDTGVSDGNNTSADSTDTSEGTAETVEAGTGAGDAVPEGSGTEPAAKPAVQTQAEVDELAAELAELGFKTPEVGRDNRIPYHRVKKILENKAKKLTDQFTTERTQLTEKMTVAERKAAEIDRVNALIESDPRRYLELLATLHPQKYRQFLQPAQPEKKAEPAPVTSALGEEPKPDHQFEDGTLGYTQEGHRKLLNWHAAKAKEDAIAAVRAEFDAKLKGLEPIQKEHEARQIHAQNAPKVKARLDQQRAIWGDAFDADYKLANEGKSEIVAYMDAHPDVSFETATAAVLRPKLVADREKIRKETHEELNKRPAAAAKKVAAPSKPEALVNDVSLSDVVKEALREQGLYN